MKKIAIRYGLWMFSGLTLFFLLMHFLGLSANYNLRIFNGVIHMGLMYVAIREFRHQYTATINNYISGVAMGMYTSLIGVGGFTIFMLLFLAFDPGFLHYLQDTMPMGLYLTPITTSLFIFVEGIAISLIGSYILTRVIDMNLAKV